MLQKSIIKFLIVAASLALHEVFFKPAYILWLEGQGRFYDFGAAFLGYMIVVGVGWFLAYFITLPMKNVKVSKD